MRRRADTDHKSNPEVARQGEFALDRKHNGGRSKEDAKPSMPRALPVINQRKIIKRKRIGRFPKYPSHPRQRCVSIFTVSVLHKPEEGMDLTD